MSLSSKRWVRSVLASLFLALPLGGLSGCGGDDGGDSGGGAQCHCEYGDFCDEHSSGCGFIECESNGMDAKAPGACAQDDVIGSCRCASEDLMTYYRSGTTDPQGECSFWCDDGVYTPR